MTLSADRAYRSREIMPWDVDRAAAPRNLLIIEKVRISGRRFSYPRAPLKEAPRYVFPRSRAKRFAHAARFAKTWLRRTRKRSRSGFILHLWWRARMLFLSKLSPIWNIRSLTLRTFLGFSFPPLIPMRRSCRRIAIFRHSLSKRFRRWLRRLAEKCRNADVGTRSCRSYDLCSCNGNDGCCNFPCQIARDCATWLTCRESGDSLIEKAQLSGGKIDKNYNNNS